MTVHESHHIDAYAEVLYNVNKIWHAEKQEKLKRVVKKLAVGIGCLISVILYMKWVGCPIRFMTGIPCAGCGMTRAWKAVLRLNFKEAHYYHPLYPLPLVVAAVFLLRKRIPPLFYKYIMYTAIALFIGVYLYRIRCGDDVLTIEIQKGIIFQIVSYLSGGS